MIKKRLAAALVMTCVLGGMANSALAEFTAETASVAVLPQHTGKHWFWTYGPGMPFTSESRAYLFDAQGTNLGQLNAGTWLNSLLFDDTRNELLTVETYFSRGTRGVRSDQVVAYDPNTLQVKREIPIPAKRMQAIKSSGATVFSDDQRFLLVVNFTPAQSVSVVDLQTQQFVTEIETPGCSVLYPAGNRDFYSICADGGFMQIRLDDRGGLLLKQRHQPLFDPAGDFVTTAASRIGNTWYFVSYDNHIRAIEMTPEGIKLSNQWSLLSDKERAANWRISGQHHTAAHRASGRLFVLMHQGDAHTFEQPGEEVWVFDTRSGNKIDTIELDDIALSIAVSQAENPTLYSLAFHVPLPILATAWIYMKDGEAGLMPHLTQVVDLYEIKTGRHVGKVGDIPRSFQTVVMPW
jgi:methylamine dehydrogenase heavy chain